MVWQSENIAITYNIVNANVESLVFPYELQWISSFVHRAD